jgi:uracil-DNA glycosylase family 4
MPRGFFPLSTIMSVKKPLPLMPACGSCGLYKTCNSEKMPPTGKGKKKILIIGEAPGEEEDRAGRQFVGKSGQTLRRMLRNAGIDPDQDCVFDNALRCRPPNNKIKDKKAVEYCRPNVLNTIKEVNPVVILLLGGNAVKSVIGHLWKENVGKISTWVGWKIPSQRFNAWVCPTYHPSYVDRQESQVLEMLVQQDIEEAMSFDSRPWKSVPEFQTQVETIYDDLTAAREMSAIVDEGRAIAFDYEANMLKPDNSKSKIVCCSVSNGRKTIAFPWHGKAIEAMRKLVRCKLPKIASNMKYEDRWTRAKLGVSVRNWKLDTMLASHVIDNRPNINSIKFQAFVHLGQEPYDDHIKPYLKTKKGGGYEPNRIEEVDMRDLMVYCGMDSLLEWKVAKIHKEELENAS